MNVFVADKLPQEALDELESLGVNVTFNPGTSAADLEKGVGDATALIVRSTVVNETCIRNSPDLTLIIRAGAGVNNIDLEAASKQGIYVANCPGQNSIAVAELAIGLILALDRSIPHNVSDFRNGERSEEHTSELQSRAPLVCRLLREQKKRKRLKNSP